MLGTVSSRTQPAATSIAAADVRYRISPGKSKVSQLHETTAANQQIVWLDISVNHL
jgi:hypothetical protein